MIKSKVCKGCNQELAIENFTKSKYVKDGYENKCKICRREQKKKHIKICEMCGAEFKTSSNSTRFCCGKCSSDFRHKDKRVEVNCAYCNKKMTRRKLLTNFENMYCSRECKWLHQKEFIGEKNSRYNRVSFSCSGCGTDIKVIPSQIKNQNYIFCSNDCYKKNIGKFFLGKDNPNYSRIECDCYYCGKKFERKPSQIDGKRTFCSQECYVKANRDKPKKAIININCEVCGKEVTIWKSKLKQAKNHYCSKECASIGYSKLYRGENHPNYNPELTDFEREKARHTPEYNDWRKSVYKRDNYTCQCCGDKSGGNLRAHHYYNYSEYKHLRHDINNGITLCECCHVNFHNMYGYKNNTKEQFEEFLKSTNKIQD